MNRYARLVNHWCPRYPDEAGGAGGGPPPPVVPAVVPEPAAEPAQPSKQEWADFHRTQRELQTQMKAIAEGMKPKEVPKPEPTKADGNVDVMAQLADMRLELDLERAMRAAKIPEGSKLSNLITTAAKATKPPNIREFVDGYADMVPAPTVPAVPVVPPTAKSDTGPAVAAKTDAGLPDGHPYRWSAEVIAKMSPEELRKAARDYENKNSGSANVLEVFEARRNRARAAEASAKK